MNGGTLPGIENQFRVAKAWLANILGVAEGDVPAFEMNSDTVPYLYSLSLFNSERDRDAEILLRDLNQKQDEYSSEGFRLNRLLRRVGVAPDCLSVSGLKSIGKLSSLAAALDLRDCDQTSLYVALSELSEEINSIDNERAKRGEQYNKLAQEVEASRAHLHEYSRVQKELEEAWGLLSREMDSETQSSTFMKEKCRQYAASSANNEAYLGEAGYTADIQHKTLVARADELKVLREKSEIMERRLAVYLDLPPDAELAKVRVLQAQEELQELEFQISRFVQSIAI